MKKFVTIFLIIILLLIIVIETPIFVNYIWRKEAVKILEKPKNIRNIKVEIYEKSLEEDWNSKIKYRTDTGLITEDAHTVTYASATSSEMYDFFIDTKTCVPRTQDIFYGNPVTNINDIDDLLKADLKEIRFRNIKYDNKLCLEIKLNNYISIYEKETGLLLKKYRESKEYEKIYKYEIDSVEKEELKPKFEEYSLDIGIYDQAANLEAILNFENLPEEYKEKIENKIEPKDT